MLWKGLLLLPFGGRKQQESWESGELIQIARDLDVCITLRWLPLTLRFHQCIYTKHCRSYFFGAILLLYNIIWRLVVPFLCVITLHSVCWPLLVPKPLDIQYKVNQYELSLTGESTAYLCWHIYNLSMHTVLKASSTQQQQPNSLVWYHTGAGHTVNAMRLG